METKKYYTFEDAREETGLFHSVGSTKNCEILEDEVIIFAPFHDFGAENVGLYYTDDYGIEGLEKGWEDHFFVKADRSISLFLSNE